MDPIWNETNLKMPPLITIKVSEVKFIKQVRSMFLRRKSPEFLFLQEELANSAALISRLMARRKNSFQHMSGFKFVCKLNTALTRILRLNVEHVLDNFHQMLPEIIVKPPLSNEVPSRNSLDFVLLRLIAMNEIFHRISSCCTESADYFNRLLRNNFFMDTITLLLAVIAKLWDITNKLGNTYSDFYSKLMSFRTSFPLVDSHTHFKDIQFPQQLTPFSIPQSNIGLDSNDSNKNDVSITICKEVTSAVPINATPVLPKLKKSEDLGMAISRDSLKPIIDLSRIHNIEDIRRFFKSEDEQRSKSLSSCSTKLILKHEWLAIQKLIERKIIANDHKKALSIFRKFITSKT